jgi:hypothetical protein
MLHVYFEAGKGACLKVAAYRTEFVLPYNNGQHTTIAHGVPLTNSSVRRTHYNTRQAEMSLVFGQRSSMSVAGQFKQSRPHSNGPRNP